MSVLSTDPASVTMGPGETLPWAFNTTNLLTGAETASSPTTKLIDLYTGEEYAAGLSGSPTVATPTITQTVTALQEGRRYLLIWGFTAAVGKVWEAETIIECVKRR